MFRNTKKNISNKQQRRVRRRRPNQNLALERPFKPSVQLELVSRTNGIIQAAAADFVVYESRLMSLAQQGFSGGTAAAPVVSNVGLADATAYALGRAKSFRISVNGSVYEGTNANDINMIFSDTQPSTVITTRALAQAASASYLHTKVQVLGVLTGQSRFRIPTVQTSAKQIVPDLEVSSDRDFICGLNPTAVSTQELWVAIIVTSQAAGLAIALGLQIDIEIITRFKAFSRLPGM